MTRSILSNSIERFIYALVLAILIPLPTMGLTGNVLAYGSVHGDSDGGIHVGNGGGLAEAHIAYIYLALDKLTQLCKSTSSCVTDQEESKYLDELAKKTLEERRSIKPGFKSGKDDPMFFVVNGQEQAFRTDSTVGSQIWFNLDKIYSIDAGNVVKALPMTDLFEILLTALSVHVPGALSDTKRIDLFDRLAMLPNGSLLEVHSRWVADSPNFGAVAYVEKSADHQMFNVVVSDLTAAFDQNAAFDKTVKDAIYKRSGSFLGVRASKVLQVSWQVPIYRGREIDTALEIKSLIDADHQEGTQRSYRCVLRFDAKFTSDSDEIERLYFLDESQSHWTAVCN